MTFFFPMNTTITIIITMAIHPYWPPPFLPGSGGGGGRGTRAKAPKLLSPHDNGFGSHVLMIPLLMILPWMS